MTDRAILVIRQSLTKADSVSLEVQEERCRAYCHQKGYAIVREPIREESTKGWRDDREAMQEVYALVRQGVVDVVVAWDTSRVARSVRLLENLIYELEQHDARFESLNESWVSSPFVRQILAAVAEEDTRKISRNVSSAKATAARMGRWQGSNPPFGYQLVKFGDAPSVLIPDSRESGIVQDIFAMFARGDTSTAISRELQARGISSRNRSAWPSAWLREIVANPVYLGCVSHRGEVVAHDAHPAIIDSDLWQRANEQLGRRAIVRYNATKPGHWLAGHVIHACGMRMYLWTRKHPGIASGWQQQFICQSRYDDGVAARRCGHDRPRLSALKLSVAVRECLVRDLEKLPTLKIALRRARHDAGGSDIMRERERLARRKATAEARYERTRDAWLGGSEPLEWLEGERAKRDALIVEIDVAIAALPEPPDVDEYRRMADRLTGMRAVLALAADDELTPVIAELGRVMVSAEGVSIAYWPAYRAWIPEPWSATLPAR